MNLGSMIIVIYELCNTSMTLVTSMTCVTTFQPLVTSIFILFLITFSTHEDIVHL